MSNPPDNRRPAQRVRRTAKALRSGVRRYPRTILDAVFDTRAGHADPAGDVLDRLADHALALSWIGHASVLARMGRTTIAVDPVLSDRIGLRVGRRVLGPARLQPSPVGPAALRSIDLVLLTHAHFDHLDRPTLAAMADDTTTVVAPPGCAKLVPPGFADVRTVAAGGAIDLGGVTVHAIEPRHWGARTVLDRHRRVNAYLAAGGGHTVLFAGDTAATAAFDKIAADVAVFGVGAYEPWEHMHATPEQVWRMFEHMDARYLLPVHHSTFELSDEPVEEPLARLKAAAGPATDRILDAAVGEVLAVE
jgi:L-ascorbate metabolism protein UlaG (beta-lactamase superfamily)